MIERIRDMVTAVVYVVSAAAAFALFLWGMAVLGLSL